MEKIVILDYVTGTTYVRDTPDGYTEADNAAQALAHDLHISLDNCEWMITSKIDIA